MSDLKPKGKKIILGYTKQPDGTMTPNEFGMRFTLNAIDDIQDKFGVSIEGIESLFKDNKNVMRNLTELLAILINEDSACVFDETGEKRKTVDARFVGRHIDVGNAKATIGVIFDVLNTGMPKAEDDDPNTQGGQQTT